MRDFDRGHHTPYTARPNACEVTCRACSKTFLATRLRGGSLRCPYCFKRQGFSKNDVTWSQVNVSHTGE
jgi:DNA-directed RNA polymerase subunit RPC12/RpoP